MTLRTFWSELKPGDRRAAEDDDLQQQFSECYRGCRKPAKCEFLTDHFVCVKSRAMVYVGSGIGVVFAVIIVGIALYCYRQHRHSQCVSHAKVLQLVDYKQDNYTEISEQGRVVCDARYQFAM